LELQEIKNRIKEKPYFETENIVLYNNDCFEIMQQIPKKAIDLILTDPPYGICGKKITGFMNKNFKNFGESQEWDLERIPKIYFDKIKQISKNQIIFGFNYYADFLGNTKEPIVWDKLTGENYFADCELAWSSFYGTCRKFTQRWCGAFKDDPSERSNYHPTQKPKKLFEKLIKKYSKSGIILDCFSGSGTTGISCLELNRQCILIEKEKKYCDISIERIKQKEAELKNEFYIPDNSNLLFKDL